MGPMVRPRLCRDGGRPYFVGRPQGATGARPQEGKASGPGGAVRPDRRHRPRRSAQCDSRGHSARPGACVSDRGPSTPSGTGFLSPYAQDVPGREIVHPYAQDVPGREIVHPHAQDVPGREIVHPHAQDVPAGELPTRDSEPGLGSGLGAEGASSRNRGRLGGLSEWRNAKDQTSLFVQSPRFLVGRGV